MAQRLGDSACYGANAKRSAKVDESVGQQVAVQQSEIGIATSQ